MEDKFIYRSTVSVRIDGVRKFITTYPFLRETPKSIIYRLDGKQKLLSKSLLGEINYGIIKSTLLDYSVAHIWNLDKDRIHTDLERLVQHQIEKFEDYQETVEKMITNLNSTDVVVDWREKS